MKKERLGEANVSWKVVLFCSKYPRVTNILYAKGSIAAGEVKEIGERR